LIYIGYLINCGSTEEKTYNDVTWISDGDFIKVGNVSEIGLPNLMPMLSTLRYFPDESARKSCYTVPVMKGAHYLVRTTYYYGQFDGGHVPPVFDQIVEGTKWTVIDTGDDYAKDMASYYEVIVGATGKTLSVCLARNSNTTTSPFISALELVQLEDSVYNATDFSNYALSTIARHRFGYEGPTVR
jgi:Malectin-like domain